MFKVPYTKPLDFNVLKSLDYLFGEDLANIAKGPDATRTIDDYSQLFSVGLPESAYEELIYFFPLACNLLWQAPPREAIYCIDGLVAFASECDASLRRDGLKRATIMCFISCLDKWTQEFEVLHHGREQMLEKGSPRLYADFVNNAEAVFNLLESLVRFETHKQLAEFYFQHLSSQGGKEFERSGWFIESCRKAANEGFSWTTSAIDEILADKPSQIFHLDILRVNAGKLNVSTTYLRDVVDILQIS